jgi:hypothetical protein
MEKQKYIFICEIPEKKQYFAGRQWDIDQLISQFEENVTERDLPFTVVGKIKEPPQGLPMGFSDRLIEWYNKEKMPDKRTIDLGVMAILQFIQNGFIF